MRLSFTSWVDRIKLEEITSISILLNETFFYIEDVNNGIKIEIDNFNSLK